jgi:hypothetical protein
MVKWIRPAECRRTGHPRHLPTQGQALGGATHPQGVAASMPPADLTVLHHQHVQGIEALINNQCRRFQRFRALDPLAGIIHPPLEPTGYRLRNFGVYSDNPQMRFHPVDAEVVVAGEPAPNLTFHALRFVFVLQHLHRQRDG